MKSNRFTKFLAAGLAAGVGLAIVPNVTAGAAECDPTTQFCFDDFDGLVAQLRDSDGDGLSDFYELRIGTDPNDADTDGDCLFDGEDDEPLVYNGGHCYIVIDDFFVIPELINPDWLKGPIGGPIGPDPVPDRVVPVEDLRVDVRNSTLRR